MSGFLDTINLFIVLYNEQVHAHEHKEVSQNNHIN